MTIDEAIAYCNEVHVICEIETDFGFKKSFVDRSSVIGRTKCGKEHKQLAEWLKDYKRLLERESCEDAISRDNAIEAVRELCNKSTGIFEENPHVDAVLEALENLPSVKPVSLIAQFRFDKDKLKEIAGRLYCPYCGAKMVESEG